MTRRMRAMLAALAALVVLAVAPPPAAAQAEQQKLVNLAAATVERLRSDSNFQQTMLARLQRARAVLIIPNLVKAGFIIGGEYGNGVLLVRGEDGAWSHPAFYTLAATSLGIQAGVQDSEVMFLIMSDRSLKAIMNNAVKLGADLSVAVLAAGAGMEASTTTALGADVLAFSHTIGIFGGGSLEGAMIKPRPTWNAAYYGGGLSAEAILLQRAASNPEAEKLRDILAR